MFKNNFKKNVINKLDYNTSMHILETHKFDMYLAYITEKTHCKPRPYKDGFILCCPAHDDRRRSFAMSQTPDGIILMKCFAYCSIEDICKSINIRVKDLFPMKSYKGYYGK